MKYCYNIDYTNTLYSIQSFKASIFVESHTQYLSSIINNAFINDLSAVLSGSILIIACSKKLALKLYNSISNAYLFNLYKDSHLFINNTLTCIITASDAFSLLKEDPLLSKYSLILLINDTSISSILIEVLFALMLQIQCKKRPNLRIIINFSESFIQSHQRFFKSIQDVNFILPCKFDLNINRHFLKYHSIRGIDNYKLIYEAYVLIVRNYPSETSFLILLQDDRNAQLLVDTFICNKINAQLFDASVIHSSCKVLIARLFDTSRISDFHGCILIFSQKDYKMIIPIGSNNICHLHTSFSIPSPFSTHFTGDVYYIESDLELNETYFNKSLLVAVFELLQLGVFPFCKLKIPSGWEKFSTESSLNYLEYLGLTENGCFSQVFTKAFNSMPLLPFHPTIVKFIISGLEFGCLHESILISSFIACTQFFDVDSSEFESNSDIFSYKFTSKSLSRFAAEEGDLISILNMMTSFVINGSQEIWCRQYYMPLEFMNRVFEVYKTLHKLFHRLQEKAFSNDTKLVQKAILKTFAPNLAYANEETASYTLYMSKSINNISFHPSSVLFHERLPKIAVGILVQLTRTKDERYKRYLHFPTVIDDIDWIKECAPSLYMF